MRNFKKIITSILFAVAFSAYAFAGDCGSDIVLLSAVDSNSHVRQVLCFDGVNLKVYSPFGLPSLGGSAGIDVMTSSAFGCPTGTTEDTSMDGIFVLGTRLFHSDVGGTGGSSTASTTTSSNSAGTPSGTVQQANFTGTQINFSQTNNISLLGLGSALGTPTSITPSGTINAQSFSGAALAGHTHTLTVSTVPPYKKFIYCTIS